MSACANINILISIFINIIFTHIFTYIFIGIFIEELCITLLTAMLSLASSNREAVIRKEKFCPEWTSQQKEFHVTPSTLRCPELALRNYY